MSGKKKVEKWVIIVANNFLYAINYLNATECESE